MQAAVVGVPGTGKTYFMVQYLKKYFSYDDFFREYQIKKDVLIITNISGLQFYGADCWDIESERCLGIPSEGRPGKYTRETFFTVKNMESIMEKTGKKNIVLVLDEVQRDEYFPLGYKHPDVLFLFAYHRHIGMDIILGTQDASLMSRGVLAQCEYLAHGTLRSKKLFSSMSYRFTDTKGNYLYSKALKTDKSVFAAYQSASVQEVHKPKNAVVHWLLICSVFFLASGLLFKTALAIVKQKGESKRVASAAPASSLPGPLPVPYSNVSSAGVVRTPLPVIAPVAPVAAWRTVHVDGYISGGGKQYFLIAGQHVESWRCRNHDRVSQTVDYYSLEPIQDSGAVSRNPVSVSGGSPERIAQGKAEPLGEASSSPLDVVPNVNSAPDYVPIPVGTPIKSASVVNRSPLHVPVQIER